MTRVLRWWRVVGADRSSIPFVGAGFALVGGLLGIGAAIVLFEYYGDYPLNVLMILLSLVGIPDLLLLISLVAMALPADKTTHLVDYVPALHRIEMRWRRWSVEAADIGRIFRWQVLLYAQIAALAFFALVASVFIVRIALSDVAFGWSTTLDVDQAEIVAWVEAWSRPWAAWLPGAVPDGELVRASQYFRLEDTIDAEARRLGGWWPFVLASFAVYGALPRIVVVAVALVRLDRLARRLLLGTRLVSELAARMLPVPEGPKPDAERRGPAQSLGPRVTILRWNDVDVGDPAAWADGKPGVAVDSQRAMSPNEPVDDLPSDVDIVVVAKGWEPPLLELTDSLHAMRAADRGIRLFVATIGFDGELRRGDAVWRAVLDDAGLEEVELV